MRIIAGEFRSRRLQAPTGPHTRPTSDRAREALFSHLEAAQLPDTGWTNLTLLDLFSGSGALGLEALSRGAAHATFVDASTHAVRAVHSNIEALRVGERTRVVRGRIPQQLGSLNGGYRLILLDPPYEHPPMPQLGVQLARLAEKAHPCIAVFEHRRGSNAPTLLSWVPVHTLQSGEATFTIYHLTSTDH